MNNNPSVKPSVSGESPTHTPTPWKHAGVFVDADERSIADCCPAGCSTPQAKANAAFIVTACNSYHQDKATVATLVGALQRLDSALSGNMNYEHQVIYTPVGVFGP